MDEIGPDAKHRARPGSTQTRFPQAGSAGVHLARRAGFPPALRQGRAKDPTCFSAPAANAQGAGGVGGAGNPGGAGSAGGAGKMPQPPSSELSPSSPSATIIKTVVFIGPR